MVRFGTLFMIIYQYIIGFQYIPYDHLPFSMKNVGLVYHTLSYVYHIVYHIFTI